MQSPGSLHTALRLPAFRCAFVPSDFGGAGRFSGRSRLSLMRLRHRLPQALHSSLGSEAVVQFSALGCGDVCSLDLPVEAHSNNYLILRQKSPRANIAPLLGQSDWLLARASSHYPRLRDPQKSRKKACEVIFIPILFSFLNGAGNSWGTTSKSRRKDATLGRSLHAGACGKVLFKWPRRVAVGRL